MQTNTTLRATDPLSSAEPPGNCAHEGKTRFHIGFTKGEKLFRKIFDSLQIHHQAHQKTFQGFQNLYRALPHTFHGLPHIHQGLVHHGCFVTQ